MNTGKFDFLLSTRFWSIVIVAASTVLVDPNFPLQEWYISVGKFLGLVGAGFTIVRTTDRVSDKKVEVAKINAKKK